MPLTRGQVAALETIAVARDPESDVAASTPLNRAQARCSSDIDILHDREEGVAGAAGVDADALSENGFALAWLRRSAGVQTLSAERDGESVRLEWVADSDCRFFPAVRDRLFGYMLHPVDLAVDKALAAGNRRELRDVVDLVAIDQTILPLGAVVLAAVEKAPGFSPESLIAEIRRNALHPREEWDALSTSAPIDPTATMAALREALDRAEAFANRMPTQKTGLLFLSGATVVQPDPDRLDDYATHAGRRRGHWPCSPGIAAAMLERFAR